MKLTGVLTTSVLLALAIGAGSVPGMAAKSASHAHTASGAAGGPVALHPATAPDGSATLMLPAGWRINGAASGGIDATGPEGGVVFGQHYQIWTPQRAAHDLSLGVPGVAVPVASYSNPAQASEELWRRLGITIHTIEQSPVSWPGGKASFLHYRSSGAQMSEQEGVAFVVMAPCADGTWVYYYSAVYAPRSQFPRSLPVLLKIWDSWKTDGRVFQQRLASAVVSMQQCSEIVMGVHERRVEAQGQAHTAWDHVIRGTWEVEDTKEHRVLHVSSSDMKEQITAHNIEEGYARYRMVPYGQLGH